MHSHNCPIIERTADGDLVGRCWYYLPDGKTCQRHGNVEKEVTVYKKHGRLTPEKEHKPEDVNK